MIEQQIADVISGTIFKKHFTVKVEDKQVKLIEVTPEAGKLKLNNVNRYVSMVRRITKVIYPKYQLV